MLSPPFRNPPYANRIASRARGRTTSPSAALRRVGRDTHDTKKTGSDIAVIQEAGSLASSDDRRHPCWPRFLHVQTAAATSSRFVPVTLPVEGIGRSDGSETLVLSQRRRLDPGLRRRMGNLRYASP